MNTIRRLLATTTVLGLVLLPGCGGENGEDAGGSAGAEDRTENTAASEQPEFTGKLPPGLEPEPAWAVEGDGDAYVVGDTVALRRPTGPLFAFHDLKSGDRTGTIEPEPEARKAYEAGEESGTDGLGAWSGTWKGEPVLYLAYTLEQESDGLSEATTTKIVEAYGTDGELVGSVSQADLETDSFTVAGGWVLLRTQVGEDGFGSDVHDEWGIATPEGELVVDSVCGEWSSEECSVWPEQNQVQLPSATFPVIDGDVAFVTTAAEDDGDRGELFDDSEDPGDVIAIDLTTGEELWNSGEIEAPEGVPTNGLEGVNPYPLAVIGDSRVLLHWRHDIGTGYEDMSNPTTPAVHDLRTGELLVTGPSELEVDDGGDSSPTPGYLVDEQAGVAVLTGSPMAEQSTAFDLETGEQLWNTDTTFRPASVVGDVLYGYRGVEDTEAIAIRITDREVLLEDFGEADGGGDPRIPVPQGVLDGTAGLVRHGGATYVFPAASE